MPLHRIRKNYVVDPIKYLLPVCPNCHAMLHKADPPFIIEDLRQLFKVKRDSFETLKVRTSELRESRPMLLLRAGQRLQIETVDSKSQM